MIKIDTNDIYDYYYPELQSSIRAIMKDDEPWFIGVDVCRILQYKRPSKALTEKISKADKIKATVGNDKNKYTTTLVLINEGALNELILDSRMPKAKDLRRWITHDVMPDLHRKGYFKIEFDPNAIRKDPDGFIQLVSKKIMIDDNVIKGLKVENSELRKKSILSQFISSSDSNFTFAEFANLLSTAGYNIGLNRLYAILRDTKYLISTGPRKNMPTQRSIEQNLVDVNIEITDTGKSRTVKTITSKGAEKFIKVIDDCLAKVNLHKDEDGQYRDEDGFIVLKPTAEQLANIKRIKKKQN